MFRASLLALWVAMGLVFLQGCSEDTPSGPDPNEQVLDLALCSTPSPGEFTLDATNPYFPMDVGSQWVLEGEEDGEPFLLQVTALDETRVIGGVTTRVMEEREFKDGELFEVTWNYHAEAPDGTNCYFGEDVDIFEDAGISHEGAWCADHPGARPGIFMPADPEVGMKFSTEVAPGLAEDENEIVAAGFSVVVPFGTFTETIRLRELNRLDGAIDFKVWASGIGIVIDGPFELESFIEDAPDGGLPIPTDQACGT